MIDFIYKKLLKPVFKASKLGNRITKGEADSGLNLDHMYLGCARGIGKFGNFIDGVLLNFPSVKATRKKRAILIKVLSNEVANNVINNKTSRIVDLASGPSRYLIDLVTKFYQHNVEVLCIDNDKFSVNFGRRITHNKPIRYTKANIFKLETLKRFSKNVKWIPNIIVITGFFETHDNNIMRKILSEIFTNLAEGGLVLFTSQMDNPSKVLMEKIGKTRNGSPWLLYFRKPDELRRSLIEIGFKDVIISIDEWGIYEYCTGRKYTVNK
ncbi:MAG: hypothetical protein A2987_05545 [Omnitrophica bacterium RIFCSPLOWO2_01_FULL_45_10]|nr:MAG: hypothetical protein A2987_05545 [Omnitrophica bacterium RIFCSPLOWO2_01_FULL_45_10]